MDDRRPDPGREPPEGCEFFAVMDEGWRAGGSSSHRCRYMLNGRSCGAPSVARFNRPRHLKTGIRPTWWHYCADHMYGRWVENGVVMTWHVRDIEPSR